MRNEGSYSQHLCQQRKHHAGRAVKRPKCGIDANHALKGQQFGQAQRQRCPGGMADHGHRRDIQRRAELGDVFCHQINAIAAAGA